MPRLNFGAFLAPHHPIGEHPMLQFRRDLELVEHLDRLGTTNSGAASTTRAAGR
jgi:limonene 1,2-monooxygenase